MIVTVIDEYGEIRSVITVGESDAEHVLKNFLTDTAAAATVIGAPPAETARRVNGEWVLRPASPDPRASWDAETATWRDMRDLERERAAKLESIGDWRVAAEAGGFDWNGLRFDSDPISQQRLVSVFGLAQFGGDDFSVDWTLADNTSITMRASDAVGVGVALANHVTAQHRIARELKARATAAATLEQLDAVQWVVA